MMFSSTKDKNWRKHLKKNLKKRRAKKGYK